MLMLLLLLLMLMLSSLSLSSSRALQSVSEVASKGILKEGQDPTRPGRRMSASLAGPAAALAKNLTKVGRSLSFHSVCLSSTLLIAPM